MKRLISAVMMFLCVSAAWGQSVEYTVSEDGWRYVKNEVSGTFDIVGYEGEGGEVDVLVEFVEDSKDYHLARIKNTYPGGGEGKITKLVFEFLNGSLNEVDLSNYSNLTDIEYHYINDYNNYLLGKLYDEEDIFSGKSVSFYVDEDGYAVAYSEGSSVEDAAEKSFKLFVVNGTETNVTVPGDVKGFYLDFEEVVDELTLTLEGTYTSETPFYGDLINPALYNTLNIVCNEESYDYLTGLFGSEANVSKVQSAAPYRVSANGWRYVKNEDGGTFDIVGYEGDGGEVEVLVELEDLDKYGQHYFLSAIKNDYPSGSEANITKLTFDFVRAGQGLLTPALEKNATYTSLSEIVFKYFNDYSYVYDESSKCYDVIKDYIVTFSRDGSYALVYESAISKESAAGSVHKLYEINEATDVVIPADVNGFFFGFESRFTTLNLTLEGTYSDENKFDNDYINYSLAESPINIYCNDDSYDYLTGLFRNRVNVSKVQSAAEVVASGECNANVAWSLDENGVLTITGSGAMPSYSNSETTPAPWEEYRSSIKKAVIGDGITTIGNYAFYGCSALASVVIPDGVTTIGGYTFSGCSSLTSVELPSGLTSLGVSAFRDCSKLASVAIPDGVKTIGGSAFYGCSSLTSVELPSGLTSLGSSAFRSCILLESVGSLGTIESIENNTFNGCNSLKEINIPSSVTSIEDYTFAHCSSLTSVELPSGLTSLGNSAFVECTLLESVGSLGTIESIGVNAFLNCKSLKEITIPSSVTTIENSAFNGCMSLTSVELPSGLTSLGSNAFHVCIVLESVGSLGVIESIGDNTFFGCNALKEINIPSSVTTIGNSAFYNCSSLTSVDIPSGLTSLGSNAFHNCTLLESIGSLGAIENIGDNTFLGCNALKEINIPSSVTTIGKGAFQSCKSLTSVELPSGLTSIGENAFYGCKTLSSIQIPANATIGSQAFKLCSNLRTVDCGYVGEGDAFDGLKIKQLFYRTETEGVENGFFDGIWKKDEFINNGTVVFVPGKYVDRYREAYSDVAFMGYDLSDEEEEDGEEEERPEWYITLDKNSVDFIAEKVNNGETLMGKEVSIALIEDVDLSSDEESWTVIGTAENPFKGEFNGNGHTIVSLGETASNKVASLFGTIGEGAKVENLTVGQASVDEEGAVESGIHLEVSEASSVNDVVDGKRISYYGVLAQENHGTISNVVFVGDFGLSDDYSATDDISVSLVADNREDGVIDHCVAYFTNLVDDEEEPAGNKSVAGNKRKIIVMQNVGTGRNAGKVVKTAANGRRKAATKAVKPGSEPEFTNINDDYRIYTDEEMMTGEPAYWMNMTGRGYSGEYEGKWSMSLDGRFPVQKTERIREVVKLVYEIEGLNEEEIESLGLDGASFARIGGEVKLTYNQSPKTISGALSVIGDEYAMLTVPELTAEDNGTVTVTLDYRSLATGMSEMKPEGREMKVTVKGHDVMLAGAEGREVTVTDVMGRQVYSKTASDGKVTLRLPSAGIYMVKAGDVVEKVVVR